MECVRALRWPLVMVVLLELQACATVAPPPLRPVIETASGSASYIAESLAGRRTASGARFDPQQSVAAHRTLPFGTRLRVTNLENGRSTVVTVVDRGPYRKSRILDVSPRAARELGFYRRGLARVRIELEDDAEVAGGDER
jgi:rare lipoprotein A